MSLKILPNELYVREGGAVIKTRCPAELVTDEMVHQRVVAANLDVGDELRVLSMNHERTAVLAFCKYLVVDRRSEMARTELNDRETRQFERISFSILRVDDWQVTPAGEEAGVGGAQAEIKWNPGTKKHQVFRGDEVVFESSDKAEAEAFLKAT